MGLVCKICRQWKLLHILKWNFVTFFFFLYIVLVENFSSNFLLRKGENKKSYVVILNWEFSVEEIKKKTKKSRVWDIFLKKIALNFYLFFDTSLSKQEIVYEISYNQPIMLLFAMIIFAEE